MCTGDIPFYTTEASKIDHTICNYPEPKLPNEFEDYKALYHKYN